MALGSTQPLTEGSRCVRHLHVPTVSKSGILNLLEPSGPVQACNGIALPSTKLRELRKKCAGEIFPTYAMKTRRGIAPLALNLGTSPR
jgi:hypothetical protein